MNGLESAKKKLDLLAEKKDALLLEIKDDYDLEDEYYEDAAAVERVINMAEQHLGGITIKEAITFQTQIMMGAQFGRIAGENVTNADLLIACLRMGWNDAFRHTSKNKKEGNTTVLEAKEKQWRKDKSHKEPHDDFICGKILNQEELLNTFKEFACAASTADKVKIIENHFPKLQSLFADYKEVCGNKCLCFGHFQKMFNIAIKLYVCLYLCRAYLDIDGQRFEEEILNNIDSADCPIDSIILGKIAEATGKNEYQNHKWSQYGIGNHPTKDYETVQKEISEAKATAGNSNLYYDFVAWKK